MSAATSGWRGAGRSMTLTEFLQAREADREVAAREEWLESLPPTPERVDDEQALSLYDRTMFAAALRMQVAVRQAGWALTPLVIKQQAALKYADHPDYRDEWRP